MMKVCKVLFYDSAISVNYGAKKLADIAYKENDDEKEGRVRNGISRCNKE